MLFFYLPMIIFGAMLETNANERRGGASGPYLWGRMAPTRGQR